MKRIGILLKSNWCDRYLYNVISELTYNDKIELFFLQNSISDLRQSFIKKLLISLKRKGLIRNIELLIFEVISYIEYIILSIFLKKIKGHYKLLNIEEFNQNKITYITPTFSSSGLVVRYTDESIDKIKKLNLDIIIRGNTPGVFKGKILM